MGFNFVGVSLNQYYGKTALLVFLIGLILLKGVV